MIKEFNINFTKKEISLIYQKVKEYPWDSIVNLEKWDHGTNKSYLKELCKYWVTDFDWNKQETKLNKFSNFISTVDGSEIVNFYSNRIELSDIQILGTEISTYNSNEDLILSAPGSGVVRVKDTFELTKTPGDDEGSVFDPSAPVEGVKLYSKTPEEGASGLFFVNEENRRDEIISKNRALLFGMLF